MRGRGDAEDISDFVRLGDLAGIGGGRLDGGGKGGFLASCETGCNLREISRTICYNNPVLISIFLFAVPVRSSVFDCRIDYIFRARSGYASTQNPWVSLG